MPVSSPYSATLLTMQYPLTHGMFMNDANFNPEANTMGKIFKASGYNTAYIGKWHGQEIKEESNIEEFEQKDTLMQGIWKDLGCFSIINKTLINKTT